MAKIWVDSALNKTTGEYEPTNWRIEGDGLIEISYEFVKGADPRYFNINGQIVTCGPYRLEVVDHFPQPDGILRCKLVEGSDTHA